jgi:heme oxygenase
MLGGRLDRQRYVLLLRNLLPVYQLLEQPDDAGGSALSGFPLDSIARAGALAQDLNALHGGGWLDEVPHLAAGRAYRDRVAACRRSAPALLAAHAYVRYLGDLSGGRVLGRALRQTLGPGSAGLAFYDFPGLTSVEAARADFRRALDALPLREEEAQAVVDEARTAFRLNLRVLEAVERPPTHAGA